MSSHPDGRSRRGFWRAGDEEVLGGDSPRGRAGHGGGGVWRRREERRRHGGDHRQGVGHHRRHDIDHGGGHDHHRAQADRGGDPPAVRAGHRRRGRQGDGLDPEVRRRHRPARLLGGRAQRPRRPEPCGVVERGHDGHAAHGRAAVRPVSLRDQRPDRRAERRRAEDRRPPLVDAGRHARRRHHDDRHDQPGRHRRPGRRHPREDRGRGQGGLQAHPHPGRPAQHPVRGHWPARGRGRSRRAQRHHRHRGGRRLRGLQGVHRQGAAEARHRVRSPARQQGVRPPPGPDERRAVPLPGIGGALQLARPVGEGHPLQPGDPGPGRRRPRHQPAAAGPPGGGLLGGAAGGRVPERGREGG